MIAYHLHVITLGEQEDSLPLSWLVIRDKINSFFASFGLAVNGNDFFDAHMRTSVDANDHFKSGASDENDSLVC